MASICVSLQFLRQLLVILQTLRDDFFWLAYICTFVTFLSHLFAMFQRNCVLLHGLSKFVHIWVIAPFSVRIKRNWQKSGRLNHAPGKILGQNPEPWKQFLNKMLNKNENWRSVLRGNVIYMSIHCYGISHRVTNIGHNTLYSVGTKKLCT